MAQLIVRGLDSAVKEQLRRRAAAHGQSMEAEARDILTRAVDLGGPSRLSRLREVAMSVGGVDDLLVPERSEAQRDVDLS